MTRRGKALGQQRAECDVADLHLPAVPAVASALTAVRHALAEWAMDTPLRPEQVEAVCVASYEALANVVEHAYPSDDPGLLDVRATCRLESGTVTVTVSDHGRWRPTAVDATSIRGRGLPLIHGLADHADIATGAAGTTVRMTWRLTGPQ